MFSFVRNATPRRLLAAIASALALMAGVTTIAIAASSNTAKPPARSLPDAVHSALSAPRVSGVTAQITFSNRLIDSSSVQAGTPLLTGATGRLWASNDGRVRLELQSQAGDVQVLFDGKTVTIYDATSKTVYKASIPPGASPHPSTTAVPSLATIERALTTLGVDANLSGAVPSNVAGQEAYTVQVAPKHDGGLLGSVQLAWDAANGAPLRMAVYAAGSSSPVLELKATEVSFGPVQRSVFAVAPPAGAKVVDLRAPAGPTNGSQQATLGASAVQKALPFPLAAPGALVGLPQREVRLAGLGADNGALVTYGRGLGAIVVLEQPASQHGAGPKQGGAEASLPSVSIDGVTGHELATALGTIVSFDRSGVSYTVIGSVPAAAAEAAARGL